MTLWGLFGSVFSSLPFDLLLSLPAPTYVVPSGSNVRPGSIQLIDGIFFLDVEILVIDLVSNFVWYYTSKSVFYVLYVSFSFYTGSESFFLFI